MTTAHRPTWTPAVGTSNARGNWATGGLSWQFSAKDEPGHKKLKFRQLGQNSEAELKRRDLKTVLEAKEENAKEEKRTGRPAAAHGDAKGGDDAQQLLLTQGGEETEDVLSKAKKYDDRDDDDSESDLSESSDDDSDDDEEALQKELEKIRREREEVRAKKEAEEAEAKAKAAQEAAMSGNVLLSMAQSTSQVKRRWNDDVVFKGQARTEPQVKKRFVNDTIRSDFHRSFLKKYVK
eukprot:TRINITY_DN7754_c0_g1_i1.p1 TRINITY_DN7754_c0_g1~~TRINITY_DN7754_c0_g1_i1.p1  ORF type:complete len:236 (-),score=98.30 TRINITY_DN7754_c0_g1_i1:486-1193(-)